MERGIKQGIEQGIKNEKIKIAKSMLILKVDIGTIAQATGLTKKEIEILR